MIVKRDYRIPSLRDGLELLLRNKHLSNEDQRLPGMTVLFVHGATYGSSDTFDYEIEGMSWMDQLAGLGFDAWCLDLPGYGQSDRPAEMNEPPEENAPLVDTEHAVQEVGRAISFIQRERGISHLDLIGYSWGTAICGTYAGLYPDNVRKLVLSGALWVEKIESENLASASPGAYRSVTVEAAFERWQAGLKTEEINALVSEEARRRWCEQTLACDPDFQLTGKLRAPSGVTKDFLRVARTGEPWYDPGLIHAPVQIVVGEQDEETTPAQGQALFSRLTSAREKRLTVLGGGTHSMLLENNRYRLFDVVSDFLRD